MTSGNTLPNPTLLIIDDDPDILHLLELLFQKAEVTVYTARSAQDGLHQLYEHQPDLILLDLMMPGMDGWETLTRIQEATDTPVLLMTGCDDSNAIARGLALGAVDYLSKPFDAQLVVARVMALLHFLDRRTPQPALDYQDEHLTIDLDRYRIFVDGQLLHLTNTERKLFFYLINHANQICTYMELLEHVWGVEYRECTQYIHVYLSRLRHKIELNPKQPQYLLKAHGVGYQFRKQS